MDRRGLVAGPYRWDAYDVRAYGVRDQPVRDGLLPGARRSAAAFAIESLVDELASELGIDPIELRMAQPRRQGDPMVDGEPWPGLGHRECLERLQAHPMWRGRVAAGGEGVGVALGVWPGGEAPAAALCRLKPDGSITIITGVVDMSGDDRAFQIIAAETFGVAVERSTVVAPTPRARRSRRSAAAASSPTRRGGDRGPLRRTHADQLLAYAARDRDRPGRPRDRRRRVSRGLARTAAGRSPSSPRS